MRPTWLASRGTPSKGNMQLSHLISVLPRVRVRGDAKITGLCFDSRRVKRGDLFVALVGANADGHAFVPDAVASGAAAVLVERAVPGINVPQVVVKDTREALGKLSARFLNYPSRRLKVVGVTGTNGKTTTTYLIRAIVEAAGKKAGIIGTIAYSTGVEETEAVNTTPESLLTQQLLSEMVRAGMEYAVMEVSSQALDQGRVNDVDFAAAVFTNLSREHLDYHKTMARYARAKARLFALLPENAVSVVNGDDRYAKIVVGDRRGVVRFGFKKGMDVRVVRCETGVKGSRFSIVSPWGEMDLVTPLPGRHNVYNCVAAVSVAAALDIDRAAIARGVAALSSVPGRLEPVDVGQKFAVFVDYAHTAVALENVLMTVRELTKHRVIVLFGCGGERDKSKRRRMRVAAESLADHCVVTSDNPRGEDPKAIIDQVMRGAEDLSKFTVEIDRRVAITRAIELARPGDLVLIAGKGHETVQIFKDRRVRFDDREVAREVLRKAASSAP